MTKGNNSDSSDVSSEIPDIDPIPYPPRDLMPPFNALADGDSVPSKFSEVAFSENDEMGIPPLPQNELRASDKIFSALSELEDLNKSIESYPKNIVLGSARKESEEYAYNDFMYVLDSVVEPFAAGDEVEKESITKMAISIIEDKDYSFSDAKGGELSDKDKFNNVAGCIDERVNVAMKRDSKKRKSAIDPDTIRNSQQSPSLGK